MITVIDWIVVNLCCPFFGTLAFAILFNVPRRFYMSCGTIGMAGWLVYYSVVKEASPAVAAFFGCITVVLISRVLTVRMKCPVTMFLIPGVFPMIPGASIYYMAYNLVMSDTAAAGKSGFGALKIAFGMALGIVIAVSIPKKWFSMEYWRNRNQKG